jgi:hypothetical protein
MRGIRININNSTARFTIEYVNKLKELNDYNRINAYLRLIDSFDYEMRLNRYQSRLLYMQKKMVLQSY